MGEEHSKTQTDPADQAGVEGGAAPPSALVRKAHVGPEEHQARAMTLAKALRLTAAKVANELFDMALAVIGFRAERYPGDALAPLFDDAVLLMLLEGPDRQRAAAVMDGALVGALIQQQTMGKVTPAPNGGDTRRLTDTDAAICAPFLDALLARVAPLPEASDDQALIGGYAFGARTQEPRLLLMAMEAQSYRVLHLTIDIEGGRRQGKLMLCLPEGAAFAGAETGVAGAAGAGPAPMEPPQARTLTEPVLALQVDLPVALTRIQLPLSQLSTLKVGDALALENADFATTRVLTPQGKTLGSGSLGQVNGVRALRLLSDRGAQDISTLDMGQGFGEVMPNGGGGDAALLALGDLDPAGVPELDALPDMPDMSDLPGLDDASEPGDSASLPDMPEMAGMPDLPDMSDLPQLDDLPDLPELPDLPDLKAG